MEELMAAAYKYTQLAKDASTPALRSEYERVSEWLTQLLVYKQEELNRKVLEVQKLQVETSIELGHDTRPDGNFLKQQLAFSIAGRLIEEELLTVSSTADVVTNSIRYRATAFVAKPRDPVVGGSK